VLSKDLGIELRRYLSDSTFRYFFQQLDVTALCAAIRDWPLAQIPGGAANLDQLVCDGKTLRGSIEHTPGGGSAFIAQVALYSAPLGVAISQVCYATGSNHERAVLKELLGELDLEGVLIQADALHTQRPFYNSSRSRGPTSSCPTKPTNRPCTARSAASSRESARSLMLQLITRRATAATSPGHWGRKRPRSPSERIGPAPAGSCSGRRGHQ